MCWNRKEKLRAKLNIGKYNNEIIKAIKKLFPYKNEIMWTTYKPNKTRTMFNKKSNRIDIACNPFIGLKIGLCEMNKTTDIRVINMQWQTNTLKRPIEVGWIAAMQQNDILLDYKRNRIECPVSA